MISKLHSPAIIIAVHVSGQPVARGAGADSGVTKRSVVANHSQLAFTLHLRFAFTGHTQECNYFYKEPRFDHNCVEVSGRSKLIKNLP